MLISRSRRFIFIHVYKVAGVSIRKALIQECNFWTDRVLVKLPGFRTLDSKRYPAHIKAEELMEELPKQFFDNYFKFAFVRNPWDWLVSLYHYVSQTPSHKRHEFVKSLGSFEAYVAYKCSPEGMRLQSDFVVDKNGEQIVDFIGRFERLPEDFASVCKRIGVKATLPHTNASTHRDYRSYYTTQMIADVLGAYSQDIERFSYTFDGLSLGHTTA
jgi:hypothetical protein